MITRTGMRSFRIALLVALAWACPRPAKATLVLSFDESSYSIPGVGNTTAVEVLVSQIAGGPQVGVGNELLSGAVTLSFATSGAAVVPSVSDVTFGSAWDSGSVISSTSGTNTLMNLGVVSLAGIANIPSTGLLLGTFTFTGMSIGSTTISVSTETPGPSFITVQGNDLDPTNTAMATINVITPAIVPEPGSLTLLSIASVTLGMGWLRLRRKSVPDRP